jgi:hypothetical protein
MRTLGLFTLLVTLTAFHFGGPFDHAATTTVEYPENIFITEFYPHARDTFYTAEDAWLELDLATQTAIVHNRERADFHFKVSTGTPYIKDGMRTNKGLFVVRKKIWQKYSTSFPDALLYRWMPFNYGIGIHGLLQNRYYNYLGKRPSSHGCVRVSREDVNRVYDMLAAGSPVLVHDGDDAAIAVAFADPRGTYRTVGDAEELLEIAERRRNRLYNGEYFLESNDKILLTTTNVLDAGMPIGDASMIPSRQRFPRPESMYLAPFSDRVAAEARTVENRHIAAFLADRETEIASETP